MTGDAGQDDILGGTSLSGQPDAGDTICGGDCVTPGLTDDHDVIAGDNALITRPGGNRVDGAHNRTVTLYELSSIDTTLYGNDSISGDQGNDRIYGQNGDDTLHGNAGDDAIEGNSGKDAVFGDQGQDDLIGGSTQGGGGVPDANDCIQGDERTNDCVASGSGGGAACRYRQRHSVGVTDDRRQRLDHAHPRRTQPAPTGSGTTSAAARRARSAP
jgi:Ca2+-binding RTX toxin-like protein